ncbi:MAG: hypothetical protein WC879_12280 [Melioribacteraceae bacterium]
MRKISEFLKSNNLIGSNITSFPYHLLSVLPWGIKCFRFYVDGEQGSDLNNGLTWATAKKTLTGALNLLPNNLNNFEVRIFLHPGTYDESFSFIRFANTTFKFFYLDQQFNTATDDFSAFIRNGAVNPIRNNNQLIFKNSAGSIVWDFGSATLNKSFYLEAIDPTNTWNQNGHFKVNKIVFQGNTSGTNILISGNVNLSTEPGCLTLDLKSANYGIYLGGTRSNLISFNLQGCKVIGGTGRCSVNEETTSSVIMFQNANFFANSWYLSNNLGNYIYWDITGVRQMFSNWELCTFALNISDASVSYAQGSLPDAFLPRIILNPEANGSVQYPNSKFRIVDGSTLARYIKELVSGVATSFLTNQLFSIGNSLIQISKNAVPADSVLGNENLTFYIDETLNKLKVKLKYSNGTIKSGEVILT